MERCHKFESEKKFFAAIKCLKRELYCKSRHFYGEHSFTENSRRLELIRKIQQIVLNTVQSISLGFPGPALNLKPRRSQWKDCRINKRLVVKARKDVPSTIVKYTNQKKRFEIIFNLLAKIFRLLQTNASMTKRELYYEQTDLFGSQAAVNAALLDICSLLSASPWELRILTTSKGLVAGDLTCRTKDGEVLDCSKPGGVLVPQNVKEIVKIESKARFILLVEKDAAFQKLLDDEAHIKYGPCILITGKGEPDVNTRLLVHRLSAELSVPILIVVDADPYGIEIMCTYRFGSLALSQYSEHLAVTEVRWVGIHPTDIAALSIPTVPFTARDFSKTRDLIARPYIQQHQQLLEQVTCLLDGGQKCEIENLAALSPTFFTDMFLSYKITSKQVI